MIKKIIPTIFLFLFIFPSILALSIDTNRTYQPKETLIAEIKGNILEPIDKSQLSFKRENVNVPVEYDIKRLGKKYFIYIILPESENNYTLTINDISTTINGEQQTTNLISNIVVAGEVIPYTISPGFVITKEDFEIKLTLNRDEETTISTNFPEEKEILMEPGENTIKFPISSAESGTLDLVLGSYAFPVFITKTLEQNKEIIEILPEFRFNPRIIESILVIDEEISYPVIILNSGKEPLTDVAFDYNRDLFILEPETIGLIAPNETKRVNLALKNKNAPVYEKIIARSNGQEIDMIVNISYTDREELSQTPYLEETYSETSNYYCSELNGKTCLASEICEGELTNTLDQSNCCVGLCTTPKAERKFAWLGYLIGGIVVLVLLIVLVKYFKTKSAKNPLDKTLSQIQKKSPISPITPISSSSSLKP